MKLVTKPLRAQAAQSSLVEGRRLVSLTTDNLTRRELRAKVIEEFLKEEPGTGKGDLVSKYTYLVDTLADGKRVFLTRPARLNNGFDFEIRVENMKFTGAKGRSTNRPSHPVIYQDLNEKKASSPTAYARLYELIKRVYECAEISPDDYVDLTFSCGLPVDMLLATIKWFFIEQDVTYWNYSGRAMFMSGVPVA